MKKLIAQALVVGVVNVALADPATPPEHLEKEYRAIAADLFVRSDEKPIRDSGNLTISVFSHAGIDVGPDYVIDLNAALPDGPGEVSVDAGALGVLRMQIITIDCTHETYEAFHARRALPVPVWRAASTLPLLAPVFQYICAPQTVPTKAKAQNSLKHNSKPVTSTAVAETIPTSSDKTYSATDAELDDITTHYPVEAYRIKAFCKRISNDGRDLPKETLCKIDEMSAWKRLSASGRLQTIDAATETECTTTPFPGGFVGEEACLKYKGADSDH